MRIRVTKAVKMNLNFFVSHSLCDIIFTSLRTPYLSLPSQWRHGDTGISVFSAGLYCHSLKSKYRNHFDQESVI